MLRQPTVRDDGDGGAVLVKHADHDERLRLRREAEILAKAQIDGVVEMVAYAEFDDRCELRLRYLEAASLAEHPPLDARALTELLLQTGATVAELHRRGICHGALRSDHILLKRPLRAVLCGFGSASEGSHSNDLAGLADLAAAEIARTSREPTSPAEHRCCSAAFEATRELAAAAHDSAGLSAAQAQETLQAWLARLGQLHQALCAEQPDPDRSAAARERDGSHMAALSASAHPDSALRATADGDDDPSAGPEPAAMNLRDRLRSDESRSSRAAARRRMQWSRQSISLAAWAGIATVAAVIAGWQALSGREPEAAALGAAAAHMADAASQPASPDPPEAQPSAEVVPDARTGASAEAPAAVTLRYSTAQPSCADASTDSDAPSQDCPETEVAAEFATEVTTEVTAGVATEFAGGRASVTASAPGTWQLGETEELPGLTCEVLIVHYGDLEVRTPVNAPESPPEPAQDHG